MIIAAPNVEQGVINISTFTCYCALVFSVNKYTVIKSVLIFMHQRWPRKKSGRTFRIVSLDVT